MCIQEVIRFLINFIKNKIKLKPKINNSKITRVELNKITRI